MITFGPQKSHYFFDTLEGVKRMIKKLNDRKVGKYALIRQKGNSWLIEEDVGDDYLDYALVEVVGNKVHAISQDVMDFLLELRAKSK
ncbi:hypothetical protein HYV57_02895 [Candidatus Peregrinibacteria bacterium]|nr:hypothetical protein [Candidatus Peregrinibacteria bacterium]